MAVQLLPLICGKGFFVNNIEARGGVGAKNRSGRNSTKGTAGRGGGNTNSRVQGQNRDVGKNEGVGKDTRGGKDGYGNKLSGRKILETWNAVGLGEGVEVNGGRKGRGFGFGMI